MVTLKISGRKQTQLIIVPPYTVIPPHSHPNVDKFIKIVYGSAYCKRGEKEKLLSVDETGKLYSITHDQIHGVETLNEPFVFLSMQEWTENIPVKSIEENWIGEKL